MTDNERAMIQPLTESNRPQPEKFTSLQPTYEDTVHPEADDWEHDAAS